MGTRNLADFREDLSVVEGMRGNSDRWLDRRINSGYMEVATGSRIIHEELRSRFSALTVADQGFIDLNTSSAVIGVESILLQNDVEDRQFYLAFTEDIDQYRREASIGLDGGRPRVWTMEGTSSIGNRIQLRPVPDDVYSLTVVAYLEPPLLSADDDTTVLDGRWDQAIHLMAVHYALMDIGQMERADVFFNRARLYMDTRIQDGSERRSSHHVPMANPETFGEMTRARRVP